MFSFTFSIKPWREYIVFMITSINQAALDELSNAIAFCKHISALRAHFSIGGEKQRGATLFYNRVETRTYKESVRGRARWKSFRMKTSSELFDANSVAMPCLHGVSCFEDRFCVFDKTPPRHYWQFNITGRKMRGKARLIDFKQKVRKSSKKFQISMFWC